MNNFIEVKNLDVFFPVHKDMFSKKKYVYAVNNVNLTIKKQSIVGLVGESGSGKTTTGQAILKIIEPTNGEIRINNCVFGADKKQDKLMRKKNQIIFQDPYSSLNPQKTIRASLETPMIVHGIGENAKDRYERIKNILNSVGLDVDILDRKPAGFSGGQLQRICIARALLLKPEFVVLDESIASLDVSIQAQIINLLKELKDKYSLTYLFISHNIAVLKYLCDEIGVMYLGKIVEYGKTKQMFEKPLHPYTKMLLGSVPIAEPQKERYRIKNSDCTGETPSPMNLPTGCSFSNRCHYATEICTTVIPEDEYIGEYRVACHRNKEINFSDN